MVFTSIYIIRQKIYVEIVLNQIKNLYKKNSCFELSSIRINRTARIHDGVSANVEKCAEWALDAIIENFQTRYKQMPFNNTAYDWVKHSINMPFVSRCRTFVEEEMSRRFDCDGMDKYNKDKQDGGTDVGI